jgi:hypothetical protein
MKMTIKTTKPRNPFVVASLRRAAGSHRKCTSAGRQRAGRELRRELQHLKHSP